MRKRERHMSSEYDDLVKAATAYFVDLKNSGQRFVSLTPGLSAVLSAKRAARPRSISPAPIATPAAQSQALPIRTAAPAPDPAPAVLEISGADKRTAFEDLKARALVCQKCPHLVRSRKSVVFGVGNLEAELMFVGEAPGADEDVQGEPFVGRAGQLLTRIIQTMGLSREQVYIANILKCRPDTPGQSSGNRKPTPEEMTTCLPYLHAQIDLIKPKILVALGSTAVEGLLNAGQGISQLRGKFKTYRGIPLMPTYHPSYLLRPQPRNVKREVWEDMMQVMEKLGMAISEKQRGYFLQNQ